MNYRHHFHAGNFADVTKHVLMLSLFRALQRKPKGFLFLDTHAGRGSYDLGTAAIGDTLARTPEWPDGIGRLWSRRDLPPAVAEYVSLVREFDAVRGNDGASARFYPGSPAIARRVGRDQDRLVFCEKHPEEFAILRHEVERTGGHLATVHEMDGYVGVRAMLPPAERRALVLIDPPYEAEDEFAQAAAAVEQGLRRLPGGVFALWYPLTQRARVDEFFSAIVALSPPATLAAEVAIAGEYSAKRLKGCGLLVINPPWQFAEEATGMLQYLAPVLSQEPGGGSQVTWLVPER